MSVRLHSLYNAFFSAFHSKQIYIPIYFYLHVFENNDSNPSFHEEQLPLIAACSGFGWMFSHKLTGSLHVKTFTQKKKNYSTYKQQSKQFQFIVVNTLFPAPSIPSVNHTSCVEFYHQSIKKIELIPSPRGHYLATIPLTKS